MDAEKIVVRSGGIGFCGLLTIVLLVLKLVGTISISWFWVFFPVLVVPMVAGAVLGVVCVLLSIMFIIEQIQKGFKKL